ncbi:hypothetical protein ABPG75_002335 [Micractinium tetrahymenae]
MFSALQQWRAPPCPASAPRAWRPTLPHSRRAPPARSSSSSEAAAAPQQHAAPATSSAPPPPPSAVGGSSAAASLPPERLKQLRRDGLALKDVIKIGRRGPAEGLARQVQQRWNTSEVARLHCHGKHAANMKLLVQQLEEATGGTVVHRAGGTVLLYRGDHRQPGEGRQGDGERQQQDLERQGGGERQQWERAGQVGGEQQQQRQQQNPLSAD